MFKRYLIILFTFSLNGQCYAQNEIPILNANFSNKGEINEYWFFIQISDPQFGMFENNQSFEKETALYERAVAIINKLKPDFVVITGDFVHDPNNDAQIQEFKRITATISRDIPVYYTPGNHDVGQIPNKASMKKYNTNHGSDKFSFKHKGSSLIGYNASLIKAKLGNLEQKQFNWLTKKLKNSKQSKHIILFAHYPFFIKAIDEPTAYSNIDLEYRKKYLDLFNENKVEAVFTGHYHNNSLSSYGVTQLVTTSALGKPLGKAPSGMRIIKVFKDRIEHEYYGLDFIPEFVNFD
jgi:3',5'-cyclic AMP phosphodiesterase CpdA